MWNGIGLVWVKRIRCMVDGRMGGRGGREIQLSKMRLDSESRIYLLWRYINPVIHPSVHSSIQSFIYINTHTRYFRFRHWHWLPARLPSQPISFNFFSFLIDIGLFLISVSVLTSFLFVWLNFYITKLILIYFLSLSRSLVLCFINRMTNDHL